MEGVGLARSHTEVAPVAQNILFEISSTPEHFEMTLEIYFEAVCYLVKVINCHS